MKFTTWKRRSSVSRCKAKEGDVFFAVSGEEAYVGAVAPFLEAMGRGYRYVGSTGIAHTMKILQNGIGMGHAALTAEVLVACEQLGLDTDSFIGLVMEAKGLGLSVFFERYAKALVTGEKTNAGLFPPKTRSWPGIWLTMWGCRRRSSRRLPRCFRRRWTKAGLTKK